MSAPAPCPSCKRADHVTTDHTDNPYFDEYVTSCGGCYDAETSGESGSYKSLDPIGYGRTAVESIADWNETVTA